MIKYIGKFTAITALGLALSGCASPSQMGQTEMQGTAGGAILGGILGGIIGNNVGDGHNQALGAAIGAALGGTAGNAYGKSADYTNQRLSALENQMNTEEVLITNPNGSVTRVRLIKTGRGYIGPRGEEYMTLPSEAQLAPIYGLR
ncbi:MAG: glycine zipper 2TM domain-containing protein [Spartobacteria bacterium]|nr:glycine zipper 2TM domain-containing protein [Spartobacteria bacterium]